MILPIEVLTLAMRSIRERLEPAGYGVVPRELPDDYADVLREELLSMGWVQDDVQDPKSWRCMLPPNIGAVLTAILQGIADPGFSFRPPPNKDEPSESNN